MMAVLEPWHNGMTVRTSTTGLLVFSIVDNLHVAHAHRGVQKQQYVDNLSVEFLHMSELLINFMVAQPGNILVALDPPPGVLLAGASKVLDALRPLGLHAPASWRQPRLVLLDVGAHKF